MILKIEKREANHALRGFGFVICTTGIYVLLWGWCIDFEWSLNHDH